MKNYPEHMKISELSARAKKPVATIRYYTRLGLLPEPIISGKTMAYYTSEHITRLDQINTLKKKGFSLTIIGEIVNGNLSKIVPDVDPHTMLTSKREAIIRSAIELFREKGYDLTNIGDIVGRAGVGKGTFYQYFQGKEDLFFECAENVFYDIGRDDPTIRDENDGMKRLWNRSHSFLKNHLHMIDMLNLLRGASLKDSKRLTRALSKVMENLIKPLHSDLQIAFEQDKVHFHDLRLLAYLVMGTGEYLSYYYQNHPGSDIDGVLMKGWEMILGPLSSSNHPKRD